MLPLATAEPAHVTICMGWLEWGMPNRHHRISGSLLDHLDIHLSVTGTTVGADGCPPLPLIGAMLVQA